MQAILFMPKIVSLKLSVVNWNSYTSFLCNNNIETPVNVFSVGEAKQ